MDAFYDAVAGRLSPAEAVAAPSPPDEEGRRAAAVLIPLFLKADALHLLYFERTNDVPTHKGQICFPGGRHDPGDPTLLHTALRETHEEIGVPADQVRVLGYLGHHYTASSTFGITAFVGVIPYPFPFVPDKFEVAEILEVPVHRLQDPALQRTEPMQWQGVTFPMRFYDIHTTPLWGATARLTEMLLETIQPLLDDLNGDRGNGA